MTIFLSLSESLPEDRATQAQHKTTPDPSQTHPGPMTNSSQAYPRPTIDPSRTCPDPGQTYPRLIPDRRQTHPKTHPRSRTAWSQPQAQPDPAQSRTGDGAGCGPGSPNTARCSAVWAGCGQSGGTCQRRSSAVLLALLLRVELVPIALAASVAERDALALSRVKGPARHRLLAGTLDDGQPAGSCGDRGLL